MTEEQHYQEFRKIFDREVRIERIRLQTLSFTRNLIRETDLDNKKIASILEVDEDYVRNTRMAFHGLSKEEQNKSTIDINYEQLGNQICDVRGKIRYAYYMYKEEGRSWDVNALDEAVSLRTWVNRERVKRLRLDLFPGDC